MFRRVLRWFATLLKICRRPQCVTKFVRSQADIADLSERTVVIVDDGGTKKWACFQCPGGCGKKIMLNLSSRRKPCWTAASDILGRPTINPSVWQQNECGCHFWIRKGDVQWCDGGKPKQTVDSDA